MRQARPPDSSAPVKSASRILDILELLADSPDGLTLAALTQRLQLPHSSAHALVQTLLDRGYAVRDDGLSIRLGHRMSHLAWRATDGIDLVTVADPVMRRINALSGFTVGLTVPSAPNVVVVHQRIGRTPERVVVGIGVAIPAYSTASGKAILSRLTREERSRLYYSSVGEGLDDVPVPDRSLLEAELQSARIDGVAYFEGPGTEWVVASPILNRAGEPTAALGIGLLTSGVERDLQQRLAALTRIGAAIISSRLGHVDPAQAAPPNMAALAQAWEGETL